jgi:hypothetical protein
MDDFALTKKELQRQINKQKGRMEILSDYKTLHLISVVRCSEILQRICYVIVVTHCLRGEEKNNSSRSVCSILDVY